MTHSFFAIMGGFVVDHSLHSTERATLTGKAILHTARTENTLPDIPRSSIQDRSKSDGLGKTLVCIQAGYIILQILGRLESGLAVTPLEINTLGHVLCALLMYAFWFNKPLDVKDPMVLTPRWARPLDAIWSMRNRTFELYRTRDRRQGQAKEREVFDHFRYETLQRTTSSSHPPSEVETGLSAKVVRNITHECRLCGRARSRQRATRFDSSSTIAIDILVCPLCSVRNAPEHATNPITANPDLGGPSIRRCHNCGKSKHPQHTGRAEYTFNRSPEILSQWPLNELLASSEGIIAIDSVDNLTTHVPEASALLGRNASPAPDARGSIDRPSIGTFSEERRPFISMELPFSDARSHIVDDTSTRAATFVGVNSPGPSAPTQALIIRQMPSKYEIGTWEVTDLVLVWHDIDDSFDDDAVRRELGDCVLWSSVSRVYCVDRGLGDACYFRSAPAAFSEILNDCMVVNTAATDRICGVQLDLPGLRRWKEAYETACDSLYTGDTFEDSALKRIEKGITPRTGNGLDTYNALQYWADDKKNQFLRHGISNWPSGVGYLRPPRKWIPKAALTFVTACYGGLHATAWYFPFPTKNEQILWRFSALTVAGTCFGFLLFTILSSVDKWSETHYFAPGFWLLLLIAGGGFLTVYCLARFFIFLEAFISLRKLPLSAYDTPDWTKVLPHL
jgi:hypothetical protein